MYVFLERSFTAQITLSFPSYNSSTIPMFHLPPSPPPQFVVSLYQYDISIFVIFYIPLVVFHIVTFSKRTQVLFVPSVPGCILTTFDISLPLLNYFVIITKLFFWYCNWLSVYQNVWCQYRKLNIVIYIHHQSIV